MIYFFVLYIGDSEKEFVENISELENAELLAHYIRRIDAFEHARRIEGKSTCILRQGFIREGTVLNLVDKGNGRNIMTEAELTASVGVTGVSMPQVNQAIGEHNQSTTAHSDIREAIAEETSEQQGQITELSKQIQDMNELLVSIRIVAFNGLLEGNIGDEIQVPASNFPSLTIAPGRTLIFDRAGSSAVYTGNIIIDTSTATGNIPIRIQSKAGFNGVIDVSAEIKQHNEDSASHGDIRESVRDLRRYADDTFATPEIVQQEIAEHNNNKQSHQTLIDADTALSERINANETNITSTITDIKGLSFVSSSAYNPATGILTLTNRDGTSLTIDISEAASTSSLDFDSNTNTLLITRPDGTVKSADLSALIPVYSGVSGAGTIDVAIENQQIRAELRTGAVVNSHLADNAVQNRNIPNNTISAEKLAHTVRESLAAAENALPSSRMAGQNQAGSVYMLVVGDTLFLSNTDPIGGV